MDSRYSRLIIVDILADVLPAVSEEGPQGLEEALLLLRDMRRAGVTRIVAATPFSAPGSPRFQNVESLERRVRALERIAQQAKIPVRLYAAHVLRLEYDIETLLTRNIAATINDSPYVLLDLTPSRRPLAQMQRMPMRLASQIRRLRILGFIPILTHIECYPPVQRNPNILLPLVSAGALLQVTIASLDGAYGDQAQQTAKTLLERDLAHVLATETPTSSIQSLAPGLEAAERLIGRERLVELVHDIPEAMIYSAPVEAPTPITIPSQHSRRRPQ